MGVTSNDFNVPFLECQKSVISDNTSELSDAISQKSDLGHRSDKVQIPGQTDGSVGKAPACLHECLSSDPQHPHNSSGQRPVSVRPVLAHGHRAIL